VAEKCSPTQETGMPYNKMPGIYLEEVSAAPRSISEVETAIPAFIGYTEKAQERDENDLFMRPLRIASLAEYEGLYGGPMPEAFDVSLLEVGGTITPTVRPARRLAANKYRMHYAMQMYFANGGGPCYIVSVGGYDDAITRGRGSGRRSVGLLGGLIMLEAVDAVTMIVFPDATALPEGDYYKLINRALTQCATLKDRMAILDVFAGDTAAFRDKISPLDADPLKYGAAYHPWLETSLQVAFAEQDVVVRAHSDEHGAEVASGSLRGACLSDAPIKKQNPALYQHIRDEVLKTVITLPPSSAIAGVYAAVDKSRGVWKAPANIELQSVRRPSIAISSAEGAALNVDVSGKSINAIRAFPGRGTRIWGARTLAGNDNEWRYIPVRRFFNMVQESVSKSTAWASFEPNNAATWDKLSSTIETYLTLKWRDGALQGSKPEQAFFVRVGLGKTMTQQDIQQGQMHVMIGLAMLRPAEYIILRLAYKMQVP